MEDIELGGEKSERGSPTPGQEEQALGKPLSQTKSRRSDALTRIASHITTRSIRDPGPPPDGGFVAWTQIFCAWLAVTNSWGFVNSFGAFQPYYESILPQTSSAISWIGSIQAFLVFSLGIFSGRALDRGWYRPTGCGYTNSRNICNEWCKDLLAIPSHSGPLYWRWWWHILHSDE
jgi:hypothetical protein